jgi:NADH-quinone oxidoreductase subunit L
MLKLNSLAFIPLLPLIGAFLLGLWGKKMERSLATIIALSTVFGSFVITVIATYTMIKNGHTPLVAVLWEWIYVGRYQVDLSLGFDQLTAALMLVVTGVGFLIHVYSTGYMADDPSYWRFFCYLNLFVAAMSMLVLGQSLPVLFIGWEGVGLASYLLIGFWYSDTEKADAGRKAFITNRIGDFGFLVGTFIVLGLFGTMDFTQLRQAVAAAGPTEAVLTVGIFAGYSVKAVVTAACIAFFIGVTGKSAQIPLFVWLPDAMAGPTPVSALIHAATMVTAGVYLMCRLSFLFAIAPDALNLVAVVGGLTAVFAATIGVAQYDIKKVLAYSTVSQLGYMVLGVGVGAYSAAFFHLITHAFFKACLFLGSGAVIHALHGEQDIRRMGGLRKYIPGTHWTFLISTLALAGIAPLSGFFSKDLILAHASERSTALGLLGSAGAFLTAFYMSRLYFMTFWGELRHPDAHMKEHIHKPGAAMELTLFVLAGLAIVGGALNLPHVFTHTDGFLDRFLAPLVGTKVLSMTAAAEYLFMAKSVVIAIAGIALGYVLYGKGVPTKAAESVVESGPLHGILYNKWFVDELYQNTIIRFTRFLGSLAAMVIDPWIIDGILVKLSSGVVTASGRILRKPQTGNVQSYAAMFVVAVAIITGWVIW